MINYSDQKITKKELASMIMSRRPVIIDIGCNDCSDTLELMQAIKDDGGIPRAVCIEADSRSAQEAAYKCANENLMLFNLAITDKDGVVEFFPSESEERAAKKGKDFFSASGSIKSPAKHLEIFPDVKFQKPVEVSCRTLSSFYVRHMNPAFIDLCWVDVNGAEKELIKGGYEILKNKVRLLYIEFSDVELFEGQIKSEELVSMLPDFELVGVYDYQGNFGNMLFKNKTGI